VKETEAERARRFRQEQPDRAAAIAARYAAKPAVRKRRAAQKRKARRAFNAALARGDADALLKWSHMRVTRMLIASRQRARAEDLPWGIERRDIETPAACQCCGKMWGRARSDRPSIDKVVPIRGYVCGNVAVICCACNRRKQDSTPAELRMLLAYVERYR
jgi:hypothetical protein